MVREILDDLKVIIQKTLGLERSAESLDASTPMLGAMPELDSLGVVQLAAELEKRFDFQIDDGELTAEVFATVGTLADFVDQKAR